MARVLRVAMGIGWCKSFLKNGYKRYLIEKHNLSLSFINIWSRGKDIQVEVTHKLSHGNRNTLRRGPQFSSAGAEAG